MNNICTEDWNLLLTLAEATGWLCAEEDGIWIVRDPRHIMASSGGTEEEAWRNLFVRVDWLDSIDYAYKLPLPEESELIVKTSRLTGKSDAALFLVKQVKDYHVYGEPTPARAIDVVFATYWSDQHAK